MSGYAVGRFAAYQGSALATPALAAGLEDAGYGVLWVGASPGGDLAAIEALLAATSRLVVATGIVNIWKDDAHTIATASLRLFERFPDRFLLGLGIGHPEATGDRYAQPYQALTDYLDVLDQEGVNPDRRVLAALGSRMLRLSADRSAGAHPYLVPPAHTKHARTMLGDGVLLAPEHKVVLDGDRERGRALGRQPVARSLSLVNYRNNLRRLGYTDDDLDGDLSDRLIDDLVAIGEPGEVAQRLNAHLAAGADHVAVHLLVPPGGDLLDGYRRLAPALRLNSTES